MPATASSSASQATMDSGSRMPGRNSPLTWSRTNLRDDLGLPSPRAERRDPVARGARKGPSPSCRRRLPRCLSSRVMIPEPRCRDHGIRGARGCQAALEQRHVVDEAPTRVGRRRPPRSRPAAAGRPALLTRPSVRCAWKGRASSGRPSPRGEGHLPMTRPTAAPRQSLTPSQMTRGGPVDGKVPIPERAISKGGMANGGASRSTASCAPRRRSHRETAA